MDSVANIIAEVKKSQNVEEMFDNVLKNIIIPLYTDKAHFIYELLQNAEDAEATQIFFELFPDRLEVLHNGKPFTLSNLKALCNAAKSDKANNPELIGKFGIGFKSVFAICDTVKVYSNSSNYHISSNENYISFSFEIYDFYKLKPINEENFVEPYTTKFVFPFSAGKQYSSYGTVDIIKYELGEKLQNLGVTTLLFLKNLKKIEYSLQYGRTMSGCYTIEAQPFNDLCMYMKAVSITDGKINKNESPAFLKFSKKVKSQRQFQTIDIAFPVAVDDFGNYEFLDNKLTEYISVYFPTATDSKLKFIVQGPFRTTPDRNSVSATDPENIRLAQVASALMEESIIYLRNKGKLNLSFIKILPLSEVSFSNFNLFKPIYDSVLKLFSHEKVLPAKNGGYVTAFSAKLPRNEELANVLDDGLLTDLINDKYFYRWLPTAITASSSKYDAIYSYFTKALHIAVIRPENLGALINANPAFLPARNNEWLVHLYKLFEGLQQSFALSSSETNLLTANIVKTASGGFVAPYRRNEEKKYIPNVFLPTDTITTEELNIVDPEVYKKSQPFFENTLRLHKLDIYQFKIHDIKKRYSANYDIDDAVHAEDLKFLLKFLRYDEHRDEVQDVINNYIRLRCTDGVCRRPHGNYLYLSIDFTGIDNQLYFSNLPETVFCVDVIYYEKLDIHKEQLVKLGAIKSIVTGDTSTGGSYSDSPWAKNPPQWYTITSFRYEFNIVIIDSVLRYITEHPNEKDSILKSKIILSVLFENEDKLRGTLYITGKTPNREKEPCKLLRTLLNYRKPWLYDQNGNLVSPHNITKYQLNEDYYGKVHVNSKGSAVYSLLEFKKSDEEEIEDLKKRTSQKQLDAYFESELKRRYHITSADLDATFGKHRSDSANLALDETSAPLEFPIGPIKNWDSLSRHVEEMFAFSRPVEYQQRLRSVRISTDPKIIRSYLKEMYRYEYSSQYACQLCHKPHYSPDCSELFNENDKELQPLNLFLCPNCRKIYQQLRRNSSVMSAFKTKILNMNKEKIQNGDHVSIPIEGREIWFTQTHFAEIQELLNLINENDKPATTKKNCSSSIEKNSKPETTVAEEITEPTKIGAPAKALQKNDTLVDGNKYVGRTIIQIGTDVTGKIIGIEDNRLRVIVNNGPKAGKEVRFSIDKVNGNNPKYDLLEN